ncbi:MAG: aminopeptidase P N-terminal domain-containing protein [Fidelibacterota bacterium]
MVRRILLSIVIFSGSLFPQDKEVFRQRRDAVRNLLGPGSALVVFTANVFNRNGDVNHEFRPHSDFWYLTGHPEPGAILLLVSPRFRGKKSIPFEEEIMFTRPRNPRIEVWTGKRLGVDGVKEKLGFASSAEVDSFQAVMQGALPHIDTLYVNRETAHRGNVPSVTLDKLMEIDLGDIEILDSGSLIHPLRHVKSDGEVQLLKKAIHITGEGLKEAMLRARPGLNEFNIEATIEYVFRDLGSERVGFPSIVASGPNATILHYTDNNRQLRSGDLLLMDVGAEYHMYTADVTRTVPVSGVFTPEQRELYTHVLKAQQATFDSVRAGMTLKDLNQVARNYLESTGFGSYFIHGVSHWLGLDVHDVGGRTAEIVEGSVFTIEPGIYIAGDDTTAPEEYRGIGIRIEDDVLMTANGPVWLSSDIPKEIEGIERIMRRRSHRFRGR